MKKLTFSFSYQKLFLFVNLFGLAAAAFLWNTTVTTIVRGCLTGGCEAVLFSPFAKIFGISIAVWGTFFYALGVVLSLFRLFDDRPIHRLAMWAYSAASVFASIYFFYLEIFKIHAICSWCKLSTLASILLLTITIFEIRKLGGFEFIKREWNTVFCKEK